MATNSMNRVLGLISATASCTMLGGTVGLGRLLWDQMRGAESPPWLLEWSARAIAADAVSRSWRSHRVAGLVALGVVCGLYCMGRYLWLELVSALSDPLGLADRISGGIFALIAAWVFVWMCFEWLAETSARARQKQPVGEVE